MTATGFQGKPTRLKTEFETVADKLGLAPDQYYASPALKEWVRRHMHKRYVPEYLLLAWHLEPSLCFSNDNWDR